MESISSSSKSEEEKVEDLKRLNSKLTDFIEMTAKRDSSAKSEIERAKDDFYTKYFYLKPDCEKSKLEKVVDAVESANEWCREHWKLIATIVIVAVAIILLATGVGTGLGAAIIAGACWGAISGAVIGGVAGGIDSQLQGGSFWEGFENGAFDGAVGGAIGGAITGGLTFGFTSGITSILGPVTTRVQGIVRGAAIGSASSGFSNMAVTGIDYWAKNGDLNGALDDVVMAGFSGVVSGGILGGILGGIQFKSPAKVAQSRQGKDNYPGIDDYVDVNMHKGDILYRGEPNGTEYFTTLDAVENSGRNATTLFEGLQVEAHQIHGYRGQVSGYQFTQTVTVGYGRALANPQFGAGGLEQFYVPNVQKLIDKGVLVLVDTINLVK